MKNQEIIAFQLSQKSQGIDIITNNSVIHLSPKDIEKVLILIPTATNNNQSIGKLLMTAGFIILKGQPALKKSLEACIKAVNNP